MQLPKIPNLTVSLDVLNNQYQPLARHEARLLDLHGDWATLALAAEASVSCLHWGSLVRFTFSDGLSCCEAEGIVVAHQVSNALKPPVKSAETGPEESDAELIASAPSALRSGCREITVHLWQCHQREERRVGPRRASRIAVLLRPEREASSTFISLVAPENAAEECWEHGWAVDLSANGMRLRTHVCLPLKQRVALQFALPMGGGTLIESAPGSSLEAARSPRQRFLLRGRVLRTERTRTAASHQAMICFEQITSEEGLALSRFLAG